MFKATAKCSNNMIAISYLTHIKVLASQYEEIQIVKGLRGNALGGCYLSVFRIASVPLIISKMLRS